jgi:hypothetical protein
MCGWFSRIRTMHSFKPELPHQSHISKVMVSTSRLTSGDEGWLQVTSHGVIPPGLTVVTGEGER